MALDLRKAIGWLLLALGVQLLAFGAFSDGAAHIMNVVWGGATAAVGALFQLAARRQGKS